MNASTAPRTPGQLFDASSLGPVGYDDDEIDLLEYWNIAYRYKWSILGLTLPVVVLTYVIVSAMTPVFRSTATLMIESKQANVVSIEQVYGIDASQREYYQTQFEVLNSRKLSEKVAKDLDIEHHPEYDPSLAHGLTIRRFVPFLAEPDRQVSKSQEWQEIVDRFRSNLTIEPVRNTQLVKIHFESEDPTLAPRVANAIGNAYIDSYLDAQLELTQKASSWLTERLKGMRADVERSEKALQDYQEKENLVDVEGVQTLTAQELNELTRKLVDARNKTSVANSQFEAVKGTTSEYSPAWETLPGVLQDSLAQRLKADEAAAESDFSGITKRYGPKHPKYIAQQSKVDAARQAFRNRVKQVVSGFEQDYQQAQLDQQQIQKELDQAKVSIQDINRKQYQLAELQREAETNRQLYDMFFKRFRETSETTFESANARFVDRAERTYAPVKPRKLMITGLAALISVMVGVLLAFLRAALDNTVKSAEDVEEKLGQGVLGVLPLEKAMFKQRESVVTIYGDHSHQTFAEATRSLRTSVILSGMDRAHKVTVVTSSVPGEGKTTVASNLALALGQMERVLLVDADMRRPTLADEYGLKTGIGLSELVAQTASLEDCLRPMEKFGIHLLPSGAVPPNPLDLLSSARFSDVLEQLKQRYDRILIDSAPTQAVSDSLVLSTKADALIYVIKADTTSASVCRNGLQRLLRVGAPVIGIVLNQFDPERVSAYGYDGYGKYGYYGYGYSSKSYS